MHKNPKGREAGVSESGRYECTTCGSFFCIDCDVFAHEVVHNCPGCLSKEISAGDGGRDGDALMDEAPVGTGDGEYPALVDGQVERRVDKGKGKFVQR